MADPGFQPIGEKLFIYLSRRKRQHDRYCIIFGNVEVDSVQVKKDDEAHPSESFVAIW